MADGDAVPAARLTAWAPLANQIFRLLWIAQFGSNVGTWTQTVGAQWLLVGHGAVLVTLVQVASGVPVLLFALPAGVLADLADRRALLLTAPATRALIASSKPGLATSSRNRRGLLTRSLPARWRLSAIRPRLSRGNHDRSTDL